MSAREDGAPDARRARTCPARSPQTDARCALPDTWRAHVATALDHEAAATGDGARAAWQVEPRDLKRWLDEPGALVAYIDELSKQHGDHTLSKAGCPRCIDSSRAERAGWVLRAVTRLAVDERAARFALAADDLRPRLQNGGFLGANGPVIFDGSPPGIFPGIPPGAASALVDEVRARRQRERGQ